MRYIISMVIACIGVNCLGAATTQPAAQTPPQIAVFAFTNAGPAEQAWIAQAVEENFVATLSRGQSLWPVRAIASPNDPNGAMTTAKNSGATYLLTGAYQVVGDELRLTGQILATSDGHVVGGLTATGPTRDLFSLEDLLAAQAKRLLAPPTPGGAVASAQPIAPTGPVTSPGSVVSNDFSAAAYQPPALFVPAYDQYYYYSMPYAYGDYGFGYGGPVILGYGGIGYGGFGNRGGFHNGFGGGFGHGHIGWGGAGVVGHAGW